MNAPADPESASNPATDFENALEELERIVQRLEGGELSLDASLEAYERGIRLYRQCHAQLERAELRVRQLSDPLDPEGGQPFDEG
ncbi:MAG: exodeoxyribonuclease 7 small subunit [Lysobacteraceae bacterium]|nr:MAG: exodeoxyribonuclease 7 small subunit [Xanthomonadaceae bacterium]